MDIKSIFENCDYEHQFLVNESANSKIELRMELTQLVSLQSRKSKRDELVKTIASELSKFKWLISGAVSIQFYWYLSHNDRHESDKSADLDNLTKPILDSLVGEDALLIDDCQIKELHIEWISKNESVKTSLLRIWIDFNNDFSLSKSKLFFVQYHNAMCTAFDTDFTELKNILGMKIALSMKIKGRRLNSKFLKVDFISANLFSV
jgi:Holliday junction resolvase RusA-like endonuclease